MDAAVPTPLKHLVYWSIATEPMTNDELDDILIICRRNNRKAGITGLLVYHNGQFVQCLEGAEPIVGSTFTRIEPDPRHKDIRVVLDESVKDRSFEAWDMACTEVCASTWLRLSRSMWEDNILDSTGHQLDHGFDLMERIWKACVADDGSKPEHAEFQAFFRGKSFPLVTMVPKPQSF